MTSPELRPLSLGELLDRSFSYYRQHFWVFVGIMALPQLFAIAMNIFLQGFQEPGPFAPSESSSAAMPSELIAVMAGFFLGFVAMMVVYFLAYALALGATTFAVSAVHLGHTTTVGGAYQRMRGRVRRLIDLVLSVMLRMMGITALILAGPLSVTLMPTVSKVPMVLGVGAALLGMLIAIPLAMILLLRYSVAVPALLLEDLRPREAIRRSVLLTKGHLGRAFLIVLLMGLISTVASSIFQGPFMVAAMVLAFKNGQYPFWLNLPMAVAGGIGQAISAPWMMIALALLYYDIRVRKEGYDLQLMMAALEKQGSSPAPV